MLYRGYGHSERTSYATPAHLIAAARAKAAKEGGPLPIASGDGHSVLIGEARVRDTAELNQVIGTTALTEKPQKIAAEPTPPRRLADEPTPIFEEAQLEVFFPSDAAAAKESTPVFRAAEATATNLKPVVLPLPEVVIDVAS